MNQKSSQLRLRDLAGNSHPFGNAQGKEVYQKLSDLVNSHADVRVFCISLAGIEATDASFPRESVIAVAKQHRGERGFCLTDIEDRDLIDNWRYAAQAKEQPLVIWHDDTYEVIGPELSSSAKALLDYVLENTVVVTAKVAADLELSVQNASTRLKKLVGDGYLLREEDVADSGGIEYKYVAIK